MSATLGVLLAGGPGARLEAGVPKALVELGGVTLLARAEALLAACCDDWVVCAPAALVLPVASARRVADAGEGPLGGLVAGLAARPFARALVLAVDLPLLRPEALRAIAGMLPGTRAVLPAPGDVPQPLAAWYAPAALAPLAAAFAAGERSATRAALALSPRLVGPEALAALPGGEAAFLNLNTPADRTRAERALGAGGAAA